MVSQPDTATSLTLRGPSSVVSRPSLSRTKRYNRSHTGGTSYIPSNEFPVFSQSGDVEIIISVAGARNRYVLHRHTLTRCSGFFEASTSQEWSRAQALPEPSSATPAVSTATSTVSVPGPQRDNDRVTRDSAAGAPLRRWHYELDIGTGGGDIPMLVQKHNTSSRDAALRATPSLFGSGSNGADDPTIHSVSGVRTSKTSTSRSQSSGHASHSFFRSVANLSLVPNNATQHSSSTLAQADIDLLRDYDNLFRIFYNYHPILDVINIADAYVQCKTLLALADQYDALAVVGPRIDHHLLQFQSRLWKQIAKYPISYLRLGYLARSRIIFQEALIHVVGQWPAGERSLRAALPDVVLDIIEDKVDELEETVSRIEARLFRLNLTTSRGERVTPKTSYLDWLAVSLFRQWLAENTSPPILDDARSSSSRTGGRDIQLRKVAHPVSNAGRAFRMLGGHGSSVILGHDECKRFLKLTPELYSRDNLRRFEKRIDELKNMARDAVRPVMGSSLELDLGGGSRTAEGIGYLTCTAVGDRDLPWHFE